MQLENETCLRLRGALCRRRYRCFFCERRNSRNQVQMLRVLPPTLSFGLLQKLLQQLRLDIGASRFPDFDRLVLFLVAIAFVLLAALGI